MLRAENIPAYMALLATADLDEIDSSLPGMSHFNHAIVYVPGSPDIWIDAIAEYAQIGNLPDADRGHRSFIIGGLRPHHQTGRLHPGGVNMDSRSVGSANDQGCDARGSCARFAIAQDRSNSPLRFRVNGSEF